MFHVLTRSGTIEGVRHNPDALIPAYGSGDPRRTYPKLRKEGYSALGAWNLAKLENLLASVCPTCGRSGAH